MCAAYGTTQSRQAHKPDGPGNAWLLCSRKMQQCSWLVIVGSSLRCQHVRK